MKKAYRLRILFFILLTSLNFNSADGMEQEEPLIERLLEKPGSTKEENYAREEECAREKEFFSRKKIKGGLLALRKKLTAQGVMIFEDGSQLPYFSIPRDIIALIAGHLARGADYTGEEGARILLGLAGDDLFLGQQRQILKYLYAEKDALRFVCSDSLQVALNWKGSCRQEVANMAVECLLEKLPEFFENKKSDSDYNDRILSFLMRTCFIGDTLLKVTSAALNKIEVVSGIRCQDGKTLLMHACKSGSKSIDTVLLLLEKDSNVNASTDEGETALMSACGNGDQSANVVSVLLKKGAEPNAIDDGGTTGLMFACENGDKSADVVSLLLEHNASTNSCSKDGYTALMSACESGNGSIRVASSLLGNRADPNAESRSGETALTLVLGELKRSQRLVNKSKVPQTSVPNCQNEKYALVRLLLDHGAEQYAPDQSKRKQGQINGSASAQGKKVVKCKDLCDLE